MGSQRRRRFAGSRDLLLTVRRNLAHESFSWKAISVDWYSGLRGVMMPPMIAQA